MIKAFQQSRLWGGVLLVSGTCIGAVTVVLPVSLVPLGFWPAVGVLLGVWALMAVTGLMVLEAVLRAGHDTSFISMAKQTLGKPGQMLSWASYALLLYSLLAAYLVGGGNMLHGALGLSWGIEMPSWSTMLPWAVVFSLAVYCGLHHIDKLNRLFVIGLLSCLAVLVCSLTPHVHMQYLMEIHPQWQWRLWPIVITAFGYQVVIPSLCHFMQDAPKSLPKAIVLGSLLPLVIYVLWITDVFGVVEPGKLAWLAQQVNPAVSLPRVLDDMMHSSLVNVTINGFVFFALSSSFLGIALSLFDFLADGLQLNKVGSHRIILTVLTMFPPLLYALFFPQGFVAALSYAGIFVAVLNVLLPALMVWVGRQTDEQPVYKAPGGMLGIWVAILAAVSIIAAEFMA